MKAYLVILTLANGSEIAEPATYEECQAVFRELRYYDATSRRMIAKHKSGASGPVVAFECRPAEHKGGVPTS